jgi:cysteine desulfurase/selenocysteine lyase
MIQEKQGELLVIPMDKNGVLDLNAYEELLKQSPKIVSIAHVSNTLATINPIKEMIALAHKYDIPVIIDGAQSMAHHIIDVQDLDCDFFVFSGHKMYAPMGVGVMYGKKDILEKLPPYQGGGEMIKDVYFEYSTYNTLPFKFEAGTPSVGDVLGLKKAIDFMQEIGIENIAKHENMLLNYAVERMQEIDGMRFIGSAPNKTSVVSFLLGNSHPYDVGVLLDKLGVAVRTGHHCTQPIMDRYEIPGTVRASFAVYNTVEEIDIMINGLRKIAPMLM